MSALKRCRWCQWRRERSTRSEIDVPNFLFSSLGNPVIKRYTKPISGIGIGAQKYNAEVRVSRSDVDSHLVQLSDRLRHVRQVRQTFSAFLNRNTFPVLLRVDVIHVFLFLEHFARPYIKRGSRKLNNARVTNGNQNFQLNSLTYF